MEIYNPGAFPSGYDPEDFITGGERPIRRNPLITSILYYSKDVESFGTGLKRIAEACKAVKCKVEFKTMKSGFVVVFYRGEKLTEAVNVQDSAQDSVQDSVQDSAQDNAQGHVQAKILAYCQIPRSRSDIAEHCGYKSVRYLTTTYLRPMIGEGLLSMTIPDKPNHRNQKYVAAKR